MDSPPVALFALAAGILIGVAAVWLVLFSIRLKHRADAEASSEVPDGAREVLSALDETAVVVDPSMTVLAASAPAELFDLSAGNTLPDQLRALARRARASGQPETESLRLRRGIELRSVIVRAGTVTPRLTLLIVRDTTEGERVEEMRRDFVANTSHELKTPVGAVSLLAEAIDSAAEDPEQVRRFAGRLIAEAARLNELTSRIMSLSRLQAGDAITQFRDIAVDEVITSAIESQALAAAAAGITVVRGGARGLFVHGDPQILSEAIANLVANAIAYSPAGGQVGVGVKSGGDTVEIAVTDRGFGIAEDEQQRVFERFYRADGARSRRTGGTGLGLSIVKHAVQRHGGEVELWSRPGRGSTFTIRLASVDAPPGADGRARKKKHKKKSSAPALRVEGEPA